MKERSAREECEPTASYKACITDELPADRGHSRLCKMRAVWVCPRGRIGRSSVPDLGGCHSDLSALSSKKLFQHLTSKNSKGPGDGGQPAPGDYHIYPVYESTDDRRALAQTHTGKRRYGGTD